LEIPTFILIRDPLDSIASFSIMKKKLRNHSSYKNDILYSIEDYLQYYNYVLENNNQSNFIMIDFNTVINNPEKFINIVSNNLNLSDNMADKIDISK